MSDNFKIMDSFEEVDETDNPKVNRKRRNSKTIAIAIVVIISLLIGIGVFVGSNAIFNPKGKKKEEPKTSIPLDLKNENVDILYHYVTYGTRNQRNDKFIKSQSVTAADFTNEEKFYYALQFAQVEDFVYTKKLNDKNQKIYNISKIKIDDYMKRFFGDNIVYSTKEEIKYPFSFRINGQNIGIMKYSNTKKGYETVFDGFQDDIKSVNTVEPYYTKLVSAEQSLIDNSITIKEKIIYTELEETGDSYSLGIFKDYNKTSIIEKKQNVTLEQLKQNPVQIESYINQAATIEYTFKVGLSNNYYFAGSKIV